MLIQLTLAHGDRRVIIDADKIVGIVEMPTTTSAAAGLTWVDTGYPEGGYTVMEPFLVVERMWREARTNKGLRMELKGVDERRTGEVARTPYPIPENGA